MTQEVRLAVPHALEDLLNLDQTMQNEVRFLLEFYQETIPLFVTESSLPLVIVMRPSDIPQWSSELLDSSHYWGYILAEETGCCYVPLETNSLLGWITLDPHLHHWRFALKQVSRELSQKFLLKELEQEVAYQEKELNSLNAIGVALSAEKNITKLLNLIVTKAMELSHADAASLYLIESIPGQPEDPNDYLKNKRFHFEVAQNRSREVAFRSAILEISKHSIYGYVALTKATLSIEDAYFIDDSREFSWAGRDFDLSINYRTKSMLTVPMLNREQNVIGVIQLINCKKYPDLPLGDYDSILDEVIPFKLHQAQAIESIASQAAVALENAKLIEAIQNLFDGFVKASVMAIESRDPTTSGHSGRVAQLTIALANAVNQCPQGVFKDVFFSEAQLQEINYASLLHDFGKIGVREEVLLKAKKLYPSEAQSIMDRFHLVRALLSSSTYKNQRDCFLHQSHEEADAYFQESEHSLLEELERLDQYLTFIIQCNEPTVIKQGGFERLREISQYTFETISRFKGPFLTPSEVASLSIQRGSLSESDRREIESHVTHTYRFLKMIPWTSNLSNVPTIAYAHHEKIDGSGYPSQLKNEQIPIQSKMMTIADIYDALTAWDRPYKKAIPVERALHILTQEAKDHHIDSDLLDVFIQTKIYQTVTRPQ